MKDKASFSLELLAAVLALVVFKDALGKFHLNFGFASINALTLAYISLGGLFVSTYFLALDYTRIGVPLLEKVPRIFLYFQAFGNYLFLMSLWSPLVYLMLWIAVSLLVWIFSLIAVWQPELPDTNTALRVASTVISLLSVVIVLRSARISLKLKREEKQEILEDQATGAASEAAKLIDKNMWGLAVVEAYKSLELSMQKKLVECGYSLSQMPSQRTIETLFHIGFFNAEDVLALKRVRNLRNQAAHGSIPISEKDASDAISFLKSLLPRLETSAEKGLAFEGSVINALIAEGLFKDGLFRVGQGLVGVLRPDASANIMDVEYLIEVKGSTNHAILEKTIRKFLELMTEKQRLILVVPSETKPLALDSATVQVLYYDVYRGRFDNLSSIKDWMSRQKSGKKT